mmetsp:Transcript_56664/g.93676  ORF Transcript_56664/g.93676 Transcript_56664/m.93676 type:complete len:327 (-) Transcript_56664:239-1219(-)|eukprot:CAMPEP_0119307334 /NCGR_PEP_ID=MMETSP1333-20130426/7871_1 /TAXON_ID=418940 /ORGANISM="Scyphosphaera apsteinii, Strain RCC1455" /LENGTH=326 /DNA_ID=CAMNT_0007310865 /DNA_START=116 /DNA_END=1096 /DNA_ORIENTATION=-
MRPLSEGLVRRVNEAMDIDWCNRSGETLLAGRWERAHLPLPFYSLVWHEAVVSLRGVLLRAAAAQLITYNEHFTVAEQKSDAAAQELVRMGGVYAFGVAQGHSLQMLGRIFPMRHRLYGFDSFKGLPEERHAASKVAIWQKGMFRALTTPATILNHTLGGASRAQIFPGFYEDTLTPALARTEAMRPAAYVDIDCDMHDSTVTALDWLLGQRLLQPGSLIGYDDFWTIPCYRHNKGTQREPTSPMDVGEGRAHREATAKYGVRFECVAGPCSVPPNTITCHKFNNWAPIFMVLEVGAARPSTGYTFTREQELWWMQSMPVCKSITQ